VTGVDGRDAVTAAEAVELVRSGVPLVDVREQDEWDAGHAPQAQLLPLSELGSRVEEVPGEGEVLVVCHAGVRSARATAALRRAGLRAVNVDGGMLAWRDAQGELTSENGRTPSVG
jgi:rhodanese-related sulfurtransferase